MSNPLPPLNSLRFFESAARHLSFTRAADELHVTQAAVSHHIKVLEEYFCVPLFRRFTRRLLLTDQGKTLLPVVQNCFERLNGVSKILAETQKRSALDVLLRPYFAAHWLVPRLNRFWQRHPDIDLRLHHSSEPFSFHNDGIDLAVRWGRGDWAGIESELLLRVDITPICSPKLMEGPHPLHCVDDLRHHTLLHEESYETWKKWLKAAGAKKVNPRRGPIIDDTNVRTQAAIDGQGVAFGALSLLQDDLATGRLVAPFDLTLNDLAYYIIYPSGGLNKPNVKLFRDWLLEEVGRQTQ